MRIPPNTGCDISYIELLEALDNDIKSDELMPHNHRILAKKHIEALKLILTKYSY